MPPTFIFVRHGEAKHNVAYHATDEKAFEDEANRDAELTDTGRKQAQETAEKLASLNIVDAWSSPLTRCIQTAEELFEGTSAQNCYVHDSLLERQCGKCICNERKSKTDIKERFQSWDTKFLPERPPHWIESENWAALHYRMRSFILLLADIYKGLPETCHILIVSHKDAIFSLLNKELQKAEFVMLTLPEILNATKKIE